MNKLILKIIIVFQIFFAHALYADILNRPASNVNNVWYEYGDSDTVFVFVHGLFSDSRDAWFYQDENEGHGTYWPELLLTDENIEHSSIFLGGYYTELDSGDYKIRDAANQLYKSLNNSISPAKTSVLEKKNIVFVTHSTGGIVVRHLLVRHKEDFNDKNLGLVLIASPSVGSRDANRFEWLADLAKQEMGKQLKWNHPLLEELDSDFKNLVDEREISCFSGVEALENHFLIKKIVFFDKKVLVEKSSAGRYFGEAFRLENTDHFSIAKPNNRQHPAYMLVRDFYGNKYSKRNRECALQRTLIIERRKRQVDTCVIEKVREHEITLNKKVNGGARSPSRDFFGGTPSSKVDVCISVGPDEKITGAQTRNTCCHGGRCSVSAPSYSNDNRKVCVTTRSKSESRDGGGGGCGKYDLFIEYKKIAPDSTKNDFNKECQVKYFNAIKG